jgi:hypothetical protein
VQRPPRGALPQAFLRVRLNAQTHIHRVGHRRERPPLELRAASRVTCVRRTAPIRVPRGGREDTRSAWGGKGGHACPSRLGARRAVAASRQPHHSQTCTHARTHTRAHARTGAEAHRYNTACAHLTPARSLAAIHPFPRRDVERSSCHASATVASRSSRLPSHQLPLPVARYARLESYCSASVSKSIGGLHSELE